MGFVTDIPSVLLPVTRGKKPPLQTDFSWIDENFPYKRKTHPLFWGISCLRWLSVAFNPKRAAPREAPFGTSCSSLPRESLIRAIRILGLRGHITRRRALPGKQMSF